MKAEDLIYEVDDEIEREKRNRAKEILKRQRKACDNLQNQADKATEKYEEMLEMDVDDLLEEYSRSVYNGEIAIFFSNPSNFPFNAD